MTKKKHITDIKFLKKYVYLIKETNQFYLDSFMTKFKCSQLDAFIAQISPGFFSLKHLQLNQNGTCLHYPVLTKSHFISFAL